MRISRNIALLLAVFLCVAAGLLAQPSHSPSPIILKRANSLQMGEENGHPRQELSGSVELVKDSLTINCDNAINYPDSGMLFFRNNVVFRDPSRTMYGDEVVYNERTEEINATGHIRVYQHDTLSATCNRAQYFDRFKQGYLYENVHMNYDSRRIALTGQQGFADNGKQYGRVTGNPVIIERDSLNRVTTKITGDTVEYFGDRNAARVSGRVRIDRDSLIATGSTLDYNTKSREAILLGKPEALRGEDHIVGDTIMLFFENNEKLSRVEVSGNAVATNPADSGFAEPKNRMEGKHMTLFVDNGQLSRVVVNGTAIATYHIREKTEKRGLNITSGDKLEIFFENRKMSRIRVEGGTEGKYTPQRLVGKTSGDH
jgi:lipopolysaccharide export system protein LptA